MRNPRLPTRAVAHQLVAAAARGNYRRWLSASRDVRRSQANVLARILGASAQTEFGSRHGFSRIATPAQFQEAVPLSGYEDYRVSIAEMIRGRRRVLVDGKVNIFEPTSGSTAAPKLIPYTPALRREFLLGLDPWLYRLYRDYPAIGRGRHYWSITPAATSPQQTEGGATIGFAEDAEYLGVIQRLLVRQTMAVPAAVSKIQSPELFRYLTLRFLVQAGDLSFVSVWHPSYFGLLLEYLEVWLPFLVHDLREGSITLPPDVSGYVPEALHQLMRPDTKRAAELSALTSVDCRSIWPNLELISCWADGSAKRAADNLKRLCPGVAFQPKGLLATEGVVTFPLGADDGAALSLNSHFFEFLPTGGGHPPYLAHQLERGQQYEVILTTGGGLYRYRLGDLVEVVGSINECPLLVFHGRSESTVDTCGEKLHEVHVREVVEGCLPALDSPVTFWLLAPEVRGRSALGYVLYLKVTVPLGCPAGRLVKLQAQVEEGLRQNFHYRYSRELGQLGELRIFLIADEYPDRVFLEHCVSSGQKLGAIKPVGLHGYQHWSRSFTGYYITDRR